LIRFALYSQLNAPMLGLTVLWFALFLALALWGYDPARGLAARKA
jgi:ABC-2 type transport system permease protein